MAEDPLAFVGSVPEHYDRFLGPFMFEPYAVDLATRVAQESPSRILELACGTGRLTRQLLAQTGAEGRIVATDLNIDMIRYARTVVPDDSRVRWETADAAALTYADGSFDAVTCQFGLMFLPDRARGMREWHRVLAPGGRLAVNVWDSLRANPAAATVHATVGEVFPADPPQFLLVPYSMHDADVLRSLAQDAGFADVEVEHVTFVGDGPTAFDVATGFAMGSPLNASLRALAPDRIDEVRSRLEVALRERHGDRPFRAEMSALVVTARRL